MTAPKFIIKDGEHGPEYFEGEDRLFFTNSNGTLAATHGNASRREEVEAWITRHNSHTAPDGPTGEPASSVDEVPSEHNKEVLENVVEDQTTERAPERPLPIICPIVGASHLGDKDPEVVEWWQKNHPEEFKKRYHNRRLQSRSGIIV